jgi:diguanylate cyclase/phosphodiesterase
MGNAGDNIKDNTTNSKIVSDELYLYSLKKMADLNAKKNESPLTGLYGIKAFFYEANELMKNNSDKKFAVIRMDIYHFKTVNEFCGREEADKLLKYISGLFCDYEGEFGVAGHFRADIFVLCTSFDDKQELIDIVNSIRSRIDQYNIQCKVLPAFGICINHNNMDVSLMCDYADLAIKKIKGKVFKTYEFYDNAMRESMLLEKKIENDVLPALKNDYIKAYVQPKVDMHNGHIIGGEALVRWQNDKEMIYPDQFIPVLEKNGYVIDVDNFIWNKVCACIKMMEDKGIEPVPISVNVSRMHVYQEKFTENLKNMAGEYGIDPKYIPLEITESAFTKEEGSLFKKVQSLQGYGFKFSMDDFGSGYSSLGMLKSERVDEVKIDKTFVDDIATDKGKVLLGNVIRMINELGIDMIAEGVETKEQADFLKENGCMYAQGYYYYKPMPIEEFAKLLENSAR